MVFPRVHFPSFGISKSSSNFFKLSRGLNFLSLTLILVNYLVDLISNVASLSASTGDLSLLGLIKG